ncbi:hypothetical protein GCL60_09915 [Silvanigrella paludirubra]|uniref:Uncharacterized protein n=1 Tax=Silvanigrella paludirubra TaxID=2499159 RepID=A0A6N6VSQ3_9BACT|nr:hypothetical protein [Silvanigrella paludirubra]KAB8039162.1 hypothetical protein GCL60_09915 [Silvanigrella paludirubra]
MYELSLFNRVLEYYQFNHDSEYRKIKYHYGTMKYEQVKKLLSDSEIKSINNLSERIFKITYNFFCQNKTSVFIFAYNTAKDYLDLIPRHEDILLSYYRNYKSIDHEYAYNSIELNSEHDNLEKVKDAIIEILLDYELKINFDHLIICLNEYKIIIG